MRAGEDLGTRVFRVTRSDLVRYAGASGDANPIHWSDRQAAAVGLPGVIAHGMYTMALAGRAVAGWAGPDAFVEYGVRFVRPVVVPDDDDGTEIIVSGIVRGVKEGVAQIDITVTNVGEKVLTQAKAWVRHSEPAPVASRQAARARSGEPEPGDFGSGESGLGE